MSTITKFFQGIDDIIDRELKEHSVQAVMPSHIRFTYGLLKLVLINTRHDPIPLVFVKIMIKGMLDAAEVSWRTWSIFIWHFGPLMIWTAIASIREV